MVELTDCWHGFGPCGILKWLLIPEDVVYLVWRKHGGLVEGNAVSDCLGGHVSD